MKYFLPKEWDNTNLFLGDLSCINGAEKSNSSFGRLFLQLFFHFGSL